MKLQCLREDLGATQRLKGLARLESMDDFKVEEIRLEVRVVEEYRHTTRRYDQSRKRYENHTVTTESQMYSNLFPIAGSFNSARGSSPDFPFDITINNYPATHHGTVKTLIKAVASVKGRPDVTKENFFIR